MTALAPGCLEASRRGCGGVAACPPASRVQPRAGADEPRVRYFPLADVRLGEGPFLAAQKLDETYLLRLEPDRMLHNFRVNAGLAAEGARVRRLGIRRALDRDPLPWSHAGPLPHAPRPACTSPRATHVSPSASTTSSRSSRSARRRPAAGSPAFPDGVAPLTDSLAGQAVRRRALVHHAQGAGRPARCLSASRQQAGARRAGEVRGLDRRGCDGCARRAASRKCSTASTAA